MIFLHGINDNTLISHLYYSVVYQDKAKNEIYTKRSIYFWVGTKPNQKPTKLWCTFLCQHWRFLNIPPHFERVLGVVGHFFQRNPNVDGEMCTAKSATFICFVKFTSAFVYSVIWNQPVGALPWLPICQLYCVNLLCIDISKKIVRLNYFWMVCKSSN